MAGRRSDFPWGTVAGLVAIVLILLLAVGNCARVYSECSDARGVVVKNNFDQPVCIEKGEH